MRKMPRKLLVSILFLILLAAFSVACSVASPTPQPIPEEGVPTGAMATPSTATDVSEKPSGIATAAATDTASSELVVTITEKPASPTSAPTLEASAAAVLPPNPSPTPVLFLGFGVETHYTDATMVEMIRQAGVTLMRRNGLLWSLVEATEGERNWGAVYSLEQELQAFSAQGIQVILIVRSSPRWAQKVPGVYCGPVSPEKLDAFAVFMRDLVSRYSAPPYNVKYWELGNEPDIDPSLVQPDSVYGCWGNKDDEYYGGGYYAEMLRAVYPAIKAADPQAQVLTGGLLLDCDPTNPPEGQSCTSAKFLEGILRNNGGDYFDFVSFHGYPQYYKGYDTDSLYPSWDKRGGVVLGKAHFLREVLAKYGVNKPLILTEGSMTCPTWNAEQCNPPGEDFYEAQADYVIQLNIKNWAAGLAATVWYQYEGPGWRYSSLLMDNRNPKPAYNALKFLTSEMSGMTFQRDRTDGTSDSDMYSGLRVYEFAGSGKHIWVVWSPDWQEKTMALPEGVLRIYNKYGIELQSADGRIVVTSPIYIEISP